MTRNRITRKMLFTALSALALSAAPIVRAADAPPRTQETVAPTGEYHVAWLTFDNGWGSGGPVQVMLGIRGTKATTVWYSGGRAPLSAHQVWSDEIAVNLNGSDLKGEIKGRLVCLGSPMAEVGQYAIAIQAANNNGKLSGTYTITLTGKTETTVKGTVTGTLQAEKQLAVQQAFPAGKDWPSWYGPGSSLRGPDCGAKMVENLKDCRPVWKSEEFVPCGWGTGPDNRYRQRAAFGGPTGGAASPVLAGGMIYQFYYLPSGSVTNEEALVQEATPHSNHPISKKWYVDFHRPKADDVLVCLDATTGKTVWKTTLKGRATNVQTHKWRGFNPTPLVADGVIYVVNYANWVYALDAKTGSLIWEYGGMSKGIVTESPASGVGPILADGVLVVPGTRGLDPKTGKELWKGPAGNVVKWTTQGKEFAIAGNCLDFRTGNTLWSCLDPKTGKTLWSLDTPLHFGSCGIYQPLVDGDFLVGLASMAKDEKGIVTYALVAYRLQPDKAEKIWSMPAPTPMLESYGLTLANGHAYIDGTKEMFCIKLDDGKVVSTVKGAGGAGNQIAFAVDGRIFIQPEGHHGTQSFLMLDGNPQGLKLMGDLWIPPHTHCGAYSHHPVSYPLVDGRLIIRGRDGVYCYDLRVQVKP